MTLGNFVLLIDRHTSDAHTNKARNRLASELSGCKEKNFPYPQVHHLLDTRPILLNQSRFFIRASGFTIKRLSEKAHPLTGCTGHSKPGIGHQLRWM